MSFKRLTIEISLQKNLWKTSSAREREGLLLCHGISAPACCVAVMNAVILPLSPFVKEERCLTQYFSVMAVTIFCLVSNISVCWFNAVGEQKQTLRPRRAVAEATSDLQILYSLNAVSVTCLMEGQGLTLRAWVRGSNGLQPGEEAEAGLQGAEYPAAEGNKTLPATSPSFLSNSLLTH